MSARAMASQKQKRASETNQESYTNYDNITSNKRNISIQEGFFILEKKIIELEKKMQLNNTNNHQNHDLDTINKKLLEQDKHIETLKSLINKTVTKNNELSEKIKTFESPISQLSNMQPLVNKLSLHLLNLEDKK